MGVAYVGLGSNIGLRAKNLSKAIEKLDCKKNLRVSEKASIYETEPVGPSSQPWFLNTAVKVEYLPKTKPKQILQYCKVIEKDLGRKGSIKWGPRIIDLDLLLVDDMVVDEENLKIPHPQISKREFVLRPLVEINPFLEHPTKGSTMIELLNNLERDKRVIKLVGKEY